MNSASLAGSASGIYRLICPGLPVETGTEGGPFKGIANLSNDLITGQITGTDLKGSGSGEYAYLITRVS